MTSFAQDAPKDTGAVSGSVSVTKPLTKKRIAVDTYQLRGSALANASAASDDYRGEMDSVVIYTALAGKLPLAQKPLAVLGQRNRRFSANLLVVAAGSKVLFPNDDPIFHNVFSLSKAKSFDLGFYPQGQSRTVVFEKAGVIDLFCHLHPNMAATILVVPGTNWTQPDREGAFKLDNLTEGENEVIAWHRAAGFFSKKINVVKGQEVKLEFILPLREP